MLAEDRVLDIDGYSTNELLENSSSLDDPIMTTVCHLLHSQSMMRSTEKPTFFHLNIISHNCIYRENSLTLHV